MKRAQTILLAVIALLLLLVFSWRFVIVEIALRRLTIPLAGAIFEAIAICGWAVMLRALTRRAIFRGSEAKPLPPAAAFAIGYPLFGSICFLAALLSTNQWLMLAIVVAGLPAGVLALRTAAVTEPLVLTVRSLPFLGFLAIACLMSFTVAALPPVTLDELAYHLAVPRAWIAEGHVVNLPLISHSFFPFGIESADVPLFSLFGATEGAIASHLLHLIAAVAAAVLMFGWARRRVDADDAAIAAAAVAMTPALLLTAGWSLVDWPLVAIVFALLSALSDLDDDATAALAIAAGLLTKYTFVPLAAIAVVSAIAVDRTDRLRVRRFVKIAIAGGVVGSLFFIRNLIASGNPFAPFLGRLSPDLANYRIAERFGDMLGNYVFEGRFIDESLGVTCAILLVALLLFFESIDEKFTRWLAAGSAIALALLLLLRPSSRILVPYLAVTAVIGWIAAARSLASRRIARWVVTGVVAAAAFAQLLLVTYFTNTLHPFWVITGRLTDREYMTQNRATFRSIAWTDSQLPKDSRTLVLGTNELYWFSHRVRGGGNFDSPRVEALLTDGGSDQLHARLRHDGITHIAYFSDGIREAGTPLTRKQAERLTVLSPRAQENLRQMLGRYGNPVADDGSVVIFEIH